MNTPAFFCGCYCCQQWKTYIEQEQLAPEPNDHAVKRARERYGIELDVKLHQTFITKIVRKKGKHIWTGYHGREAWDIRYKNRTFRVVYSPNEKQLITFLKK